MSYKDHIQRKYDPNNWTTTGPNKSRNLKNINFSLNENDYESPDDFKWDELLGELISRAIVDIAKYDTSSDNYITAHQFIFGEALDMWCIAFGRNMNTDAIRNNTKNIIMNESKRQEFLRHVYDQQIRKREHSIGRSNNKKLPTNGIPQKGDSKLPLGKQDSGGEF